MWTLKRFRSQNIARLVVLLSLQVLETCRLYIQTFCARILQEIRRMVEGYAITVHCPQDSYLNYNVYKS